MHDIVDTAVAAGSFTTLAAAVTAAGLPVADPCGGDSEGQFPAHLTMKRLIAPFPMQWGRQREHFFGRGGIVKGG